MVTVKADNRRRVQLPDAKPGQVFAYSSDGDGRISLVEVQPKAESPVKRAKVRFEKRGRFTAAFTDRPINEEAIKELLAEFP